MTIFEVQDILIKVLDNQRILHADDMLTIGGSYQELGVGHNAAARLAKAPIKAGFEVTAVDGSVFQGTIIKKH